MNNPRYSVVIPVFNEEGALQELHRRLLQVMETLDGSFEILLVLPHGAERVVGR